MLQTGVFRQQDELFFNIIFIEITFIIKNNYKPNFVFILECVVSVVAWGNDTHYDMKMTIILPRKTISLYMYSLGDMLLSRLATLQD